MSYKVEGQMNIFDFIQKDTGGFSWDADINDIHIRLINLAATHDLTVCGVEWSIWSHVPKYGYRMTFEAEGRKEQFTKEFYEGLQEIADFAKERMIELSPCEPIFYDDDKPDVMYIHTTFMDKERRKRK